MGTNHPVAEVQLVAVVTASLRKYQVLETSVVFGATIQATPPLRQIRNPLLIILSPSDELCTRKFSFAIEFQIVCPTTIADIILLYFLIFMKERGYKVQVTKYKVQ